IYATFGLTLTRSTPKNSVTEEASMEVRPTLNDETQYFVSSETGEGEYELRYAQGRWMCSCKAYLKTKQPCKHIDRLLEYLKERDGGVEPEETEAGMAVPPPSTPTLSKWVKRIHGKDFITYEGLLAMAHEQGLMTLGAEFVSVTLDLALAKASAY